MSDDRAPAVDQQRATDGRQAASTPKALTGPEGSNPSPAGANITRPAARWRSEIDAALVARWPALIPRSGVDWIEAQVWQESSGNPAAKSPVGAMGLLQLMPGTAAELGVRDAFDPRENLRAGVLYLRRQYEQLGEVPNDDERLLWAFASYNGGRGYVDFNGGEVNTGLELAKARGLALRHAEWWRWDFGKLDLSRVTFKGRRPDWRQMVEYVDHIRRRFGLIRAGA